MRGVIALLCLVLTMAVHVGAGEPLEVKERIEHFPVGANKIKVEHYEPQVEGKHPAVLVLYGMGGMSKYGDDFRAYAKELAARGHVAMIVHYFDNGEQAKDDLVGPDGPKAAAQTHILQNFTKWLEAVREGVNYAAKLPNVDANRIGMLGFSMGGYVALSESTRNARVTAVVDYFGGVSPLFAALARKMPPALVLHGDADTVVPVTEAKKVETLYKRTNSPIEVKIYEGEGHGFKGEAQKDATERTLKFLEKHLKPSENHGG